jgi:hypothetical protein
MWAMFTHFAADIGAYWQDSEFGPSVRARYQFLSQAAQGVDMTVGLRYKSRGFDPRNGELEALVAAGHRFGRVDAIVDLVGGAELGGPGLDLELKALAAYRLTDQVRLGLDVRAQAEVRDEAGFKRPDLAADVAIIGGAALSWFPIPSLQLQGLVGATKPRGVLNAGPAAHFLVAFDF